MSRFETDVLTQTTHLAALMDLSGRWIDAVHERRPVHEIILDLDSSVSETYGEQEGSAYNGHFGCTCYHPAVLLQPVRRSRTGVAPPWQRGQRR